MLTSALVDDPNQVFINEVPGQTVTVLEIRVAKRDVPKVIGRQGKHLQAIRTIIEAAGQKLQRKLVVEVLD